LKNASLLPHPRVESLLNFFNVAPTRVLVVDFTEIFDHAEKKFELCWDRCTEIFHEGRVIVDNHGGNVELRLEELEKLSKEASHQGDKKLAHEILIDYMSENELKEIYIVNN